MNTLPETPEEIDEFIRAVDAGEIECPPAPNAKIIARMCVMTSQIEKLKETLRPFADAAEKVDAQSEEQYRLVGSRISENASSGWEIKRKHLDAARKILGENAAPTRPGQPESGHPET